MSENNIYYSGSQAKWDNFNNMLFGSHVSLVW